MQGVMKITANLLDGYDHLFHNLPVGVLLIDKNDKINYLNKVAQDMLDVDGNILNTSMDVLFDHASTTEVKQLHHHKETHDTIKKSGKQVITRYSPCLSDQGELLGIVVLVESLTTFHERVSYLTNIDLVQGVLQELLNSHAKFRVVLVDYSEWLISDYWWDELRNISPYVDEWVHKLAKNAMESRREIKDSFQDNNIMSHHMEIISKPIQRNGKLIGCVQFLNADKLNEGEQELQFAKKMIRKLEKTYQIDDIIGESPAINIAREQAKLYAKMETPILIRGEKGTGKYMLARVIHALSDRCSHPFLRCNFSELAGLNNLDMELEYLLRSGRNGTIYFYINEMIAKDKQKRLLEFVNNSSEIRVVFGSSMALTSKYWYDPFHEMIQRYQITLPALKERQDDMYLLVDTILAKYNRQYHTNISKVDSEVIEYWKSCTWHGNIGQLEKTLENIVLQSGMFINVISQKQLINDDVKENNYQHTASSNMTLQTAIDQFEKDYIMLALEQNDYNKTKTAKSLGVSVRSLYYKVDKYKIDRGAP
ncbi:Transcriptional regulator containing PAS, AAA-type ATPase, and DNA-binding Fis domains [Gracilibacillus orientalis]|uniref:Transcriptional regulator containing PAS, AAA-type ATPase, and DNA-binding Fis domains n=1 Tax=Gracilibacillus orientalis TaxID=334253 RepID=A0A1I4KX80_9BACI|nr:helix-turn-helix domain-containing protein [Gracilibacillus orientalis]SFL83402.1 Transcriptional regulator containing PAS, AAA-type ATPase, and DNA-binding Fis domains [Gracilibacillus orientalis]